MEDTNWASYKLILTSTVTLISINLRGFLNLVALPTPTTPMKTVAQTILFLLILDAAVVVVAQHLRDRPDSATNPATDNHNSSGSKDDVPTASTVVPWTDLLPTLSNGSYSNIHNDPFVKTDDWLNQCMRMFEDDGTRPVLPLSNWNLMDQPSGLCMNTASCAYENCTGPIMDSMITPQDFINIIFSYRYNSSVITDDMLVNDDRLNLPKLVVHPRHVGDIAETIKFANDHKIGISVKTSGHSYTGSSTKKDTILLNMRKLRSYSSSSHCKLFTTAWWSHEYATFYSTVRRIN